MSEEEKNSWRYNTTVVLGSNMDPAERALWLGAQAKYGQYANVTLLEDTPDNWEKVKNAPGPVVFVGGPSQNKLMRKAVEEGLLGDETESVGLLRVQKGKTSTGNKIVVVSTSKGYDNMARKGAEASPLAKIMPPEAVPVAAVSISALLMMLLNAIFPFLQAVFEKKAQEIGDSRLSDKKETAPKGKKTAKAVAPQPLAFFGIKVREVLAIILSSAVLAAAITYTFTGPSPLDFALLFLLNIFICGLTQIAHDLLQYGLAAIEGVECEYVFWKAGAAVTLFSSLLGNPFGLSGFLHKEDPKKQDEATLKDRKRIEAAAAIIPGMLFFFWAFFFAAINFLVPLVLLQMVFTVLAFVAFLDFIPIRPLDGAAIWNWNKLAWIVLFVPAVIAYALITFFF